MAPVGVSRSPELTARYRMSRRLYDVVPPPVGTVAHTPLNPTTEDEESPMTPVTTDHTDAEVGACLRDPPRVPGRFLFHRHDSHLLTLHRHRDVKPRL